jgi:hypothetical protein
VRFWNVVNAVEIGVASEDLIAAYISRRLPAINFISSHSHSHSHNSYPLISLSPVIYTSSAHSTACANGTIVYRIRTDIADVCRHPIHRVQPLYGTRVDLPTTIRMQIPHLRDSWTRAVARSGANWRGYYQWRMFYSHTRPGICNRSGHPTTPLPPAGPPRRPRRI